jgi:hypothetical protein
MTGGGIEAAGEPPGAVPFPGSLPFARVQRPGQKGKT